MRKQTVTKHRPVRSFVVVSTGVVVAIVINCLGDCCRISPQA